MKYSQEDFDRISALLRDHSLALRQKTERFRAEAARLSKQLQELQIAMEFVDSLSPKKATRTEPCEFCGLSILPEKMESHVSRHTRGIIKTIEQQIEVPGTLKPALWPGVRFPCAKGEWSMTAGSAGGASLLQRFTETEVKAGEHTTPVPWH